MNDFRAFDVSNWLSSEYGNANGSISSGINNKTGQSDVKLKAKSGDRLVVIFYKKEHVYKEGDRSSYDAFNICID